MNITLLSLCQIAFYCSFFAKHIHINIFAETPLSIAVPDAPPPSLLDWSTLEQSCLRTHATRPQHCSIRLASVKRHRTQRGQRLLLILPITFCQQPLFSDFWWIMCHVYITSPRHVTWEGWIQSVWVPDSAGNGSHSGCSSQHT